MGYGSTLCSIFKLIGYSFGVQKNHFFEQTHAARKQFRITPDHVRDMRWIFMIFPSTS